MPSGNIGYRLIMSATSLLLETTGVGQHRIRLIVPSGKTKSRQTARLFYCHSRAGGNLLPRSVHMFDDIIGELPAAQWIPTFVGMTIWLVPFNKYYFIFPVCIACNKVLNNDSALFNASCRQPESDGYQLSVKCSHVIRFMRL